MIKPNTQTADVLQHLLNYEKITSMEAFEKFGCTRLADVIYRLRRKGHDITTLDTVCTNRYNTRINYATYRYNGIL